PIAPRPPHDAAERGTVEQPADREGDDEARCDDDQVVDRHGGAQHLELAVRQVEPGGRAGGGAPDHPERGFDHEAGGGGGEGPVPKIIRSDSSIMRTTAKVRRSWNVSSRS